MVASYHILITYHTTISSYHIMITLQYHDRIPYRDSIIPYHNIMPYQDVVVPYHDNIIPYQNISYHDNAIGQVYQVLMYHDTIVIIIWGRELRTLLWATTTGKSDHQASSWEGNTIGFRLSVVQKHKNYEATHDSRASRSRKLRHVAPRTSHRISPLPYTSNSTHAIMSYSCRRRDSPENSPSSNEGRNRPAPTPR